jgi:lycopene cyclase
MDKPVIILGGGIWGSLLALRLKDALPEIDFILYEESSVLGQGHTLTFRESDATNSMEWLKPIISQSWEKSQIRLNSKNRTIHEKWHLIAPERLQQVLTRKLGNKLRINKTLTPEFALKDSSFVIDTRNSCYFKRTGFKKNLTYEIEILQGHELRDPVIFDSCVNQKERFRCLSYFPLDSQRILIKDSWYSTNLSIQMDEMRSALGDFISTKGWGSARILREEGHCSELPLSPPVFREEGRVISLGGLFHDLTGCSIVMATSLIEEMIKTSFRFGELKELIRGFRQKMEFERKYIRLLNQQIMEENPGKMFEFIFSQSDAFLKRFSGLNLSVMDRPRMIALSSKIKAETIFETMFHSKMPLDVKGSDSFSNG